MGGLDGRMQMYELYDPCTVMFFYRYVALWCISLLLNSHSNVPDHARNKHIMIDLGTGNNNKM